MQSAPTPSAATSTSAVSTWAAPAKGVLRSLYDFRFTSLIAPTIIRVVYILLVVLFSLIAVVLLIAFLATGKALAILFGLIFVPIVYLIYLIITRIVMEFFIVFFRMGDDVETIRAAGGSLDGAGSPPPAPEGGRF